MNFILVHADLILCSLVLELLGRLNFDHEACKTAHSWKIVIIPFTYCFNHCTFSSLVFHFQCLVSVL